MAGTLAPLVLGIGVVLGQLPPHLAHEDDQWQHDREAPYDGPGYSESAGGSPPISFPSAGVELSSWIPVTDLDPNATAASDCWGYTSPSGREYALVGYSHGTAFVEVTDPFSPQLLSVHAGPTSSWRDIKTYQSYAYAGSEAGSGIQVFDLANIDAGTVTHVGNVSTGGKASSHNVAVDEVGGYLYLAGGGGSPYLGIRAFDLSNPAAPSLVGEWHDRYCHDAQVVTWTQAPYAGAEIAFCYANDTSTSGHPGLTIIDVSNKASMQTIGSIDLTAAPIFSHAAWYAHQGWLSPDRRYVYFDDEVDEYAQATPTTTRVIDVQDLANPVQVATFSNGNTARDHNLYTRGSLIYEANYRSGLRVFHASNPLAPVEVAFFDTYPDNDAASYNGLWSVYPYFDSGTIIGSDIEKGLFVWRLEASAVPALGPAAIAALAAALVALVAVVARRVA